MKYITCIFEQIVSQELENRQIYKGVVWFIKRGVIVGETLVWWKGLAKELELDIESVDETKEESTEVTEEVVPVPSEEPEEEKKEETPENPIEDKIVFTPVTTTPEEEKDASDPVVNPDFNSRNANSYRNEYNGGGKKKHHRR